VSIIRSFLASHAVSGPVWCLVRCVLQSCCVVTATAVTTQQDWRTPRNKHNCYSSYNTAGLEDTTKQAQLLQQLQHSRTGGHNEPSTTATAVTAQQDWRTQRNKHNCYSSYNTAGLEDTTKQAQLLQQLRHSRTGGHNEPSKTATAVTTQQDWRTQRNKHNCYSSYNTAGLEDTTNQAPHGTRDCMCS